MIETVGPEAVSVEDQFVLPPHCVHHRNRNTGTPSKRRRLLDTLLALLDSPPASLAALSREVLRVIGHLGGGGSMPGR